MSRHKGHYGQRHRPPASNINITNVTNVTNVTKVTNVNVRAAKPFRQGRQKQYRERPPKLMRFCHSAGLLDSDKAASMSPAEIGYETCKVGVYDAKQAWECLEGMASSVCNMGSGLWQMGESAVGLAGSVCKAVGALFK